MAVHLRIRKYLEQLKHGLAPLAQRLSQFFRRSKKATLYYLKGLVEQLNTKDIFLWAQAIAFKVLVTIVPMGILFTGIAGQVLRREDTFQTISNLIRDFFPDYESDRFIGMIQEFLNISGTLTIIGVIGLLFASLTLFTTLRSVLAGVFQEEWHAHRSILKGYLFDFRMTLQVGLFFILSMTFSILVLNLNDFGLEVLNQVGLDFEWIQSGWSRTFKILTPLLLSVAMFFQLYYLVPIPHPPRKSALFGAGVAALLWEVAKGGFTLYASNIGFERYLISAFGETFVLIIALIFWAYYSGIILNIGALMTLLHETYRREKAEQLLLDLNMQRSQDAYADAESPLETVAKDLSVN